MTCSIRHSSLLFSLLNLRSKSQTYRRWPTAVNHGTNAAETREGIRTFTASQWPKRYLLSFLLCIISATGNFHFCCLTACLFSTDDCSGMEGKCLAAGRIFYWLQLLISITAPAGQFEIQTKNADGVGWTCNDKALTCDYRGALLPDDHRTVSPDKLQLRQWPTKIGAFCHGRRLKGSVSKRTEGTNGHRLNLGTALPTLARCLLGTQLPPTKSHMCDFEK